ncbi:MAG: GNAT family N-acetyltransferase [Paracoccaceae bacterium]
MTPVLETERLTLCGPELVDQDGFTEFLMSNRAQFAGRTDDKAEAVQEYLEMIEFWKHNDLGTFVVVRKDNDRAIGHVGGLKPEGWPECELGWSIWRDEDEGLGFASEAAIAVLYYAFGTLNWNTAVSYVAPDNKKSIKMIEKLGAALDTDATKPKGLRCHVYRHAAPEALQ